MNALTQIIPLDGSATIDENKEFSYFAAMTDNRKRREARDVEESLKERNRQRREQREARRHLIRNCKLMLLGAAAVASIAVAVMAWDNTPVLAIFPAALAVLALSRGLNL